jgi:hypothetical protein
MDKKKIAIKGTTQEHLPIEDIAENMIIGKDGSCCFVLETSSVNFDLLSQREQEAMIYAYAAILNSLTFPLQVFIRSTVKDLSSYIRYLRSWEEKSQNPLVKKQISHYREFVAEVVEKNNVLTKSFYIVIPFSSYSIGVESIKSNLPFSFLGTKKEKTLPVSKSKVIEKAKANLEPKKDHVLRVFARLGLKLRQLNTKELMSLFYGIYNEESAEIKNISLSDFAAPVVRKETTPRTSAPTNEENDNTAVADKNGQKEQAKKVDTKGEQQ